MGNHPLVRNGVAYHQPLVQPVPAAGACTSNHTITRMRAHAMNVAGFFIAAYIHVHPQHITPIQGHQRTRHNYYMHVTTCMKLAERERERELRRETSRHIVLKTCAQLRSTIHMLFSIFIGIFFLMGWGTTPRSGTEWHTTNA